MAKRVKSKEFLSDSDSDCDDVSTKQEKVKKPKKVEKPDKDERKSDDNVWELGKMKKVSIGEFKGTKYVNIREFYKDKESGEERPGRKGITLNRAQWAEFMKVVKDVNTAFT